MAKEICMIQRSDWKKISSVLHQDETVMESPEAVIARALQIANNQLELMKQKNTALAGTVAVQNQQITEMQPKASYYDVVLNCKDLITTTAIAKDYGKSAVWMNRYLHENGVQFKQGDIWLLYQKYAEKGYTSTKTHSYAGADGEMHTKVHTYWTQKGRLFIYELMKVVVMLNRAGGLIGYDINKYNQKVIMIQQLISSYQNILKEKADKKSAF
jgi:anti-repressor protein